MSETLPFIDASAREFPSYISYLLNDEMPYIPLPPAINQLPKELSRKFALPVEFTLLTSLIMTSAHIGQSIRLGSYGDCGMPVNLRMAVCFKNRRNLGLLFRTLGQGIYQSEENLLNSHIRRKGKPLCEEEEKAFVNECMQKDPKERDGKFLNEAAQTKQKFEGTIKPHLIFESGSPDELFYQLASSADSGLLMLSDEGLPLKDFNESYSSSQKSEFLRLMRHSSGLDPIKKSMSKSEWKYAPKPLSSVLWTTDFPTLCTSLKDESMQETGFWNDFFLMDIQGISELETYRAEVLLESLPEWQSCINSCYRTRKLSVILITPDKQSAKILADFREELLSILPSFSLEQRPYVAKWLTNAQKLAVNMQMMGYGGGDFLTAEFTKAGVELAKWIGARTLQLQHHANHMQHKKDDLRAEEVMLEKLKSKGPVDLRNLCRSYRKQSKSLHEPVLRSLISKGLATLGKDELIRVAA